LHSIKPALIKGLRFHAPSLFEGHLQRFHLLGSSGNLFHNRAVADGYLGEIAYPVAGCYTLTITLLWNWQEIVSRKDYPN
jgi:hypothetical protein